jgi:hypothetical protein
LTAAALHLYVADGHRSFTGLFKTINMDDPSETPTLTAVISHSTLPVKLTSF